MTRIPIASLPLLILVAALFMAAPAEAADVTVTAASLRVRSGPSTRYRVIGIVRSGQRLPLRSTQGAWTQVGFGRGTGWVHSSYVRAVGGGASPSPTGRRRSRAGFVQFPASGAGFTSYTVASKRWGKPALVYAIERTGSAWAQQRMPRFGVGNLSRENGGRLPPHDSHRRGEDVDVRPMRTSGEGPVTIHQRAYSRTRTAQLIAAIRQRVAVEQVLFNDRRISGVRYWRGHDNHVHLRIR